MVCQLVGGLWGGSMWGGWDACGEGCSYPTEGKVQSIAATLLPQTKKPSTRVGVTQSFSPLRLLLWASLFVGARGQLTDPFPATLELTNLEGTTGFVVNGETTSASSGYSISSAGDVNGDGLADIIIGAYKEDPGGRNGAGKTYVVYGSRGPYPGGSLDLSTLDGTTGLVLNGEQQRDNSGYSVSSAGDINGDGISDLVIGAPKAPQDIRNPGKTYVVYGQRGSYPGGMLDLSALNGITGFVLNGDQPGDFSGESVSAAGDLNGDGLADFVIGARKAKTGSSNNQAGKTYLINGSSSPFPGGLIELVNISGKLGFMFYSNQEFDFCGHSVSPAGDVNGDGLADLVIGCYGSDPGSRIDAGKTYVVFGRRGLFPGSSLELSTLNGTMGFVLNGDEAGDNSGISVSSARDVNGDGLSDLIIGASGANPGGRSEAGQTYVVFGQRDPFPGGSLDLSTLDGTTGFVLNGDQAGDRSGFSVSSAGDVNGDGLSDLVIGAYGANAGGRKQAGKTYVVFGRRGLLPGGSLDLSSLDGTTGFVLNGDQADDWSGYSVSSAGDVNGDGISDLIIGAYGADPGGIVDAGKTYIVFGRKQFQSSTQAATSASISPLSSFTPPVSTSQLTISTLSKTTSRVSSSTSSKPTPTLHTTLIQRTPPQSPTKSSAPFLSAVPSTPTATLPFSQNSQTFPQASLSSDVTTSQYQSALTSLSQSSGLLTSKLLQTTASYLERVSGRPATTQNGDERSTTQTASETDKMTKPVETNESGLIAGVTVAAVFCSIATGGVAVLCHKRKKLKNDKVIDFEMVESPEAHDEAGLEEPIYDTVQPIYAGATTVYDGLEILEQEKN